MKPTRALPALAALNGLLAVALGAFGAHAVTDLQAKDWIGTATLFQLPHAVALLALLAWRPFNRGAHVAGWLLGIGSLLFASALYAIALGAPRGLAGAAPVGGVLMLLGWISVGVVAWAGAGDRRRGI
jgi:uncharacterized membrane protein YgdD (TMEM256/DUF423 family)